MGKRVISFIVAIVLVLATGLAYTQSQCYTYNPTTGVWVWNPSCGTPVTSTVPPGIPTAPYLKWFNGQWTVSGPISASAYVSFDTAVAAAGTVTTGLEVDKTLPLMGNVTVPASLEVSFQSGHPVAINGHTLTFATMPDIGDFKAFTGSTGSVVFPPGSTVKSVWFDSLESTATLLGTQPVTLNINRPQTLTAPVTFNTAVVKDCGSVITNSFPITFTGSFTAPACQQFTSGEVVLPSLVDVWWFGVKGDGINYDAYMKMALASAVLSNKPMFFWPGFYLYTTSLVAPATSSVSFVGSGMDNTFLYQHNGSTDGAIHVDGGKGTVNSGAVYNVTNKPSGCTIRDMGVGSNSGPGIYLHDASNVTVDRVTTWPAHADWATLEINGGAMNNYSASFFGGSNLATPYPWTLANFPDHPMYSKNAVRIKPQGTTRTYISEHIFSQSRFGSDNTAGAFEVTNSDGATVTSFGIMLNNCHLKHATGQRAIKLDSAYLQVNNSWIETAAIGEAAVEVLNTYGPAGFYANQLVANGSQLKTSMVGAGAIELKLSGGSLKSLNVATVPIALLKVRDTEIEVDPYTTSPLYKQATVFSWAGSGWPNSNNLIDSWTTNASYPYNTFAATGRNITSAVKNGAGDKEADSNPFRTVKDSGYVAMIQLVLTSGDAPALTILNGAGSSYGSYTLVNGVNTISYQEPTGGAAARLVLVNTTNANWAANISMFQVDR